MMSDPAMDYSVRYEYWAQFDSLTMGEIAWMIRGVDPKLEDELPDWADSDLTHEVQVLVAAACAGTVEVAEQLGSSPRIETRIKRNASLFAWLRDKGWSKVADGLDAQTSRQPQTMAKRPVQRRHAQESAILDELSSQGYTPTALPRPPTGKAGPKASVRKALMAKTDLFTSKGIFDKAWERLRASGAIR